MATPKFQWPDKRVWDGREFRSTERPAQPSSLDSGWSNKPANSLQQAFENGSYRFRDKNGVMQVITIQPVRSRGPRNTYRFKVVPAENIPKSYGTQDANKNRAAASAVSTDPNVNVSLAKRTIEAQNSKTQQYHHMMDLQYYAPYFDGLDDLQAQRFRKFLQRRGFFPGDDGRNYVGLIGSNHGPNSEHQGGIHPATNNIRRRNAVDPADIAGMTLEQRMAHILPALYADRAELGRLIRDRRRQQIRLQPFPSNPEIQAEDAALLAESTNPIASTPKFKAAVQRAYGNGTTNGTTSNGTTGTKPKPRRTNQPRMRVIGGSVGLGAFDGYGHDPTEYIPRGRTVVTGDGPDIQAPNMEILPILPIAIP